MKFNMANYYSSYNFINFYSLPSRNCVEPIQNRGTTRNEEVEEREGVQEDGVSNLPPAQGASHQQEQDGSRGVQHQQSGLCLEG